MSMLAQLPAPTSWLDADLFMQLVRISEQIYEQLKRLPELLYQHIRVSVAAVGLGIALSLPLGVIATRFKPMRWPTLMFASIVQTVPALALLALIFLALLGIKAGWMWMFDLSNDEAPFRALGFLPTVIALTLYSMLPMLRNTVTGILGVDPAATEAARGIGMRPRQVLWRIEAPLAAPVIIAGIRTAAVWTVGMATLSPLIGQPSLGDYVIQGLQTDQPIPVLVGCFFAAVFAIIVDQLLGLFERGVTARSRPHVLVAGVFLIALVAIAIIPPIVSAISSGQTEPAQSTPAAANANGSSDQARIPAPTIQIGAKPFNESYILSDLIARRLSDRYPATTRKGLGSTVAFNALATNELDCYVDYTGTIWATVMKRKPISDSDRMLREMTAWLEQRHDIRCLGSLGFQNAYALAVRRDFAERHDLETISDLAPLAPQLRLGSDLEFFSREEWTDLKQTYDLNFSARRTMQPTLMYGAIHSHELDVITAYTSDARIAEYDLKVLEDDRGALPPYDAVILLSPEAAQRAPLVRRLQPLIGAIDVQLMRRANRLVDLQNRTTPEAARWLDAQLRDAEPDTQE